MNFKQYINEISKRDLENIDLNRNLLFNNIFGDKLRVVIPLGEDLETREFMDELEDLGYTVTYSDLVHKKVIYKKIKTKEGTKERAEKVGKVLQNEIKKLSVRSPAVNLSRDGMLLAALQKSGQEYIKKYTKMLDWWQKNSENLKNSDSGSSVIISRSPIDLVRMSDHDNISSCHSPDRSHFKCAKQEAKTGGAVAYVVKNSDLKDVDIQKPELFEDEERKIEGIVPLERLRLRRFSKGEIDLLVPEIKTYGTSNVGFYGKVKQWATDSQKDTLEKLDPEKDYENFDLKGGSYQDSRADKIWSSFFDNSVIGHKTSLDDEEEENEDDDDGDNIYDAAEAQIRRHARAWQHFSVHHDIYDENTLDYSAYCSFSIPRKLFTLSNDWKDKNYREIKKVIESNIDIYSISDVELNDEDEKDCIFNISVQNDDPDYQNNQLTRLEHFLDYIDDIDRNFDTHVSKVYSGLINKGYIKSVSDKLKFKNFTMEEDDYEGTTIKSVEEKIAYLKDFPVTESSRSSSGHYSNRQMFKSGGKIYINDFRNHLVNSTEFKNLKIFPFDLKPSEINFYLKDGMAKIDKTEEKESSGGVYKDPDNFDPVPSNITKITGWVYFELEKTIGFNIASNTKTIQFLKNVDNNWDFYVKKLNKAFEVFVKMKTNGIRGLGGTTPLPTKKNFPQKPIIKKQDKQLTFKDFVNKKT